MACIYECMKKTKKKEFFKGLLGPIIAIITTIDERLTAMVMTFNDNEKNQNRKDFMGKYICLLIRFWSITYFNLLPNFINI